MFVHYLNDQIIKLYELDQKYNTAYLSALLKDAVIYNSIASVDCLYIPVVDLVQSAAVQQLQEFLLLMADAGLVRFIGSTVSVGKILDEKKIHFGGTGIHGEWDLQSSMNILNRFSPYFSKREFSTTAEMGFRWYDAFEDLESGGESYSVRRLKRVVSNKKDKEILRLYEIPSKLSGKAFLWGVIEEEKILPKKIYSPHSNSFEFVLANIWVESYVEEYGGAIVGILQESTKIDCGTRYNDDVRLINLEETKRLIEYLGVDDILRKQCNNEDIIKLLVSYEFKESLRLLSTYSKEAIMMAHDLGKQSLHSVQHINCAEKVIHMLKRYIESPVANISRFTSQSRNGRISMTENKDKKIFIGHGRSKLWMELKDFINDRLGYSWEEFNRIPVAGVTITQRLQDMLNVSDFAFVILTAEDEHTDGTIHARENAVHEVGLFQGKLGIEKALIMLEEGCEEFSNINGLNQIRFPKGNIRASFEDIRIILEQRL